MRGLNRGLLIAALLAGVRPAAGAEPQKTAATQPAARGADQKIEYLIGPGDILQIFVWKEPELTRDVMVRIDGRITVALLGDVEAAGRTPQQLGEELAKSLARFLETPRVTVGISQANSTRFFVLGQVFKSGDFPLSGRTTVLQGLALAGGFREFAKTDNIVIIRQEHSGQTIIPVNYKKLEDGKDTSQNVVLRPGDTIVVP